MRLSNLIAFLSIIFTNNLFSQITIKGKITDSSSVGIPNSYLTVSSAKDSSLIIFKMSEAQGNYQFPLPDAQKIRIVISAVGYQNISQLFDIQKDSIINFQLFPSIKLLEEVNVTAQRPVSFKEDTAIYNANFYRSPSDKNLNDLLKKLPGVEINQGKIFVQGQEIKNLMIEGEELYENNPKLLGNALSAETVDKIEIIDNFQGPNNPNSFNSNNKALNIKIRDDKKNTPTGTFTGGGGITEKYLANINTFLLKNKTKWNVLANSNNVGKSIFTFEDYLQFSGKLDDLISSGGGNLQLSSDDIPQGIFQENVIAPRVGNTMLAASVAHEINSKLKLKNHTIFNRSSAQELLNINRIYSNITESQYFENQEINRNSTWIESKTGLRYAISKTDNILYNFKINYADNQRNSDVNNQFLGMKNSSEEFKQNTQLNLFNQLVWSHIYTPKNRLIVDLKYLYSSGNEDFNFKSNQNTFGDLLNKMPINIQNSIVFQNNSFQPNQQFSANFTNRRNISKSITLNGSFGVNIFEQRSNFIVLNQDSLRFWNVDLLNQTANYSLQKTFGEIMFKWQYKKAEITLGTSMNFYSLNFLGQVNNAKINTFQLEPTLQTKLKFSQSHVLSLGYILSNSLPEMQQLNENYSIESFRKISRGNQLLSLSQRHNFNVQYFLFDLFHHVNATFFGRYSLNINPIRNNSFTDVRRDFNQFVNIGKDDNLQLNTMLGKDFYSIPVSVKASGELSVFDSQNLFNNVSNPFKNETMSYQLLVNSRFKGIFNLEASYKNTFRKLKIISSENVLSNQLQKINGTISIKPSEQFLIKFQGDWVDLTRENTPSASLMLANIFAEFHISKKAVIQFEGYNLLNNQQVSDATVSPTFSQSQVRNVLGRYCMLSLEYRF